MGRLSGILCYCPRLTALRLGIGLPPPRLLGVCGCGGQGSGSTEGGGLGRCIFPGLVVTHLEDEDVAKGGILLLQADFLIN